MGVPVIIGCISIVKSGEKFVSIVCSKGRGQILPGGKWAPGETFKECAARELCEETGLIAASQEFVYGGMSTDGAYVMAFETRVSDYATRDSPEGEVVLSTWNDLLRSDFRAYYEVLRDVLARRPLRNH